MSERSIARSGTYRRLRPMTPPAPPPSLGPCEFPKCPDPKCERDTTVHCVHDKSEHLWPHTVPPDSMHHLLIRSADTTAPPPCEPCEQIEIDSAFSYHTLDLHAEIAELRALLAEYIDWHDDELGVDTPAEGNEPYWLERARAALAPKENPSP